MATAILQRDIQASSTVETPADASGRLNSADLGVSFSRVIRSEWIKFRSLRSNWLTLISTVLLLIGFAAIAATTFGADGDGFGDPTTSFLSGSLLAQIFVGIVGVLAITSEFANGMIRSSFAAVPKRTPILWAKAVVVAGVSLVIAVPAMFAAFFVGSALYTGETISLTDDGVLRVVIGSAGYLVAIALLGLGIGAILRQAAASIGAIFVMLLLAPQLLGFLVPASIRDTFLQYLPSNAGSAFTSTGLDDSLLSPTMGALVLAAWVVGFLGVAAFLVKRRDA